MERLINIEDFPTGPFNKKEQLMEICYGDALDQIEDAMTIRQSILVECDKQLTINLLVALRNRLIKKGKDPKNVLQLLKKKSNSAVQQLPGVQGLIGILEETLLEDLSEKVVVLEHLDLMALGADNVLDNRARDMAYYLNFRPDVVFLGFKDPEIPLPDNMKRFFCINISIFGTDRQHLPKVITREEAMRFGDIKIDIYNLYKHLSGLNVLKIRQIMERIKNFCGIYPAGYEDVKRELRRRTLAASDVELPDVKFSDIGGCDEVILKLKHEVLRFLDYTINCPVEKFKEIEELIPRNILFEGPPGTGKTLLAKALANHLNAAVIVVNGPEFIDKFVGESERKLREIFLKARRSAPSVIIFDEIDSIGRSRSSEEKKTGTNDTIVNQLLTEMAGFRSDETVFVIGTTNHAQVLDPALLSRIHKIFNIPYPNEAGRRKIIEIYNKKKKLNLHKIQIDFLVKKTESWINPQSWRKFGGRELEAICMAISREIFGMSPCIKDGIAISPISSEKLNSIVEEQIEVHFPKVTFENIGGYDKVKKKLNEDILSMMKLAVENRNDTQKLKTIEESIPKGIIFEGPPGTGKTYFAMALSNALGASIIIVKASELKSMWYGESEKNIRILFEQARKNSPTIIVFDEMDAMMSSRSSTDGSSSNVERSIVNQLLTEMDGLASRDMVFVIGTTNLSSVLDPAFKRPSRFSHIIHIPYPSEDDRREIIKIYDKKYDLNLTSEQYEIILKETENWIDANKYIRFSGDHLRSICQAIQSRNIKNEKYNKNGQSNDQYLWLKRIIGNMIQVPFTPVDLEKDIGGYEHVKRVLNEDILDLLLLARSRKDKKEEVSAIRNAIPKGVVFYGPPGTGKTLFAKALATALRASVRVISGPELKSAMHGETERQIREIFDQARQNTPSVIVFDEFDSIAGDRRALAGTERSVVNQLLTEMDGLKENDLVFVVATTNHKDILDEAMKRPGRFEFLIEIPYPDEPERRAIFEIYNKKYNLSLTKENIDYLVFRTEIFADVITGRKFSGDHIEAICRALMREKYRDPDRKIDNKLLDMIVIGRTNQVEKISDEEKNIIAVHEIGHALVSKYHPKGVKPKRVSISCELAGALGYVWHGEPERKFSQTTEDLKAQICSLLGGRAAEMIVLNEQSVGCEQDLKEATRLAHAMVTSLGMDEKIGPRYLSDIGLEIGTGIGSISHKMLIHPDLIKLIDEGISRILIECQQKTEDILKEHKDEILELKERLLKEETINF